MLAHLIAATLASLSGQEQPYSASAPVPVAGAAYQGRTLSDQDAALFRQGLAHVFPGFSSKSTLVIVQS